MGKQLSEETKRKREETFKKHRYEKAEKEIGNKYNHLTILSINKERTEEEYAKGNRYGVFFNCECDCDEHNIVVTTLQRMKSGRSKSCGCTKFNNPLNCEDLTGQRFGRLVVRCRDIERDKQEIKDGKKRGNAHWFCDCDCGGFTSTTGYQLKSGNTQSCGCYASEQIAKRNKKYSTKLNRVEFTETTALLYDNNNNQCIIDKEDYEIIKNWFWRKQEKRGDIDKGYWITNSKENDGFDKSVIPIHQIIARIKYGEYDQKEFMPDHLKRNTNDNRKCNIILKRNIDNTHNRSLSKANRSGKTGVRFDASKNKYQAYICVNYKQIHLGYFDTDEEATEARLKAEEKYGFTCDDIYPEYDIAK